MKHTSRKDGNSFPNASLGEPKNALDEMATILDVFLAAEEENNCEHKNQPHFFQKKLKTMQCGASACKCSPFHLESKASQTAPLLRHSSSSLQPFFHHPGGEHPFGSISQHYGFLNGLPVELFEEIGARYHSSSSNISSLWVFPQKWILRERDPFCGTTPQPLRNRDDYYFLPPLLLLDEGRCGEGSEDKVLPHSKPQSAFSLHSAHFSIPSPSFRYRALLEKVIPKRKQRKNSKIYPLSLLDYSISALSDHCKYMEKRLRQQQHPKRHLTLKVLIHPEKDQNSNVEEPKIEHYPQASEGDHEEEVHEKMARNLHTIAPLHEPEEMRRNVRDVLEKLRKQRRWAYVQRGKMRGRRLPHRLFHGFPLCTSSSVASASFAEMDKVSPSSSSPPYAPGRGSGDAEDEAPHRGFSSPPSPTFGSHGSVLLLPLPHEAHPCYDGVQLESGHHYQVVKYVGEHLCPAAKKGFTLVYPDLHIVHPVANNVTYDAVSYGVRPSVGWPSMVSPTTSCSSPDASDVNSGSPRTDECRLPTRSPCTLSSPFKERRAISPPPEWFNSTAGKALAAALFQRTNPGKVFDDEEEPPNTINQTGEDGENHLRGEREEHTFATCHHSSPTLPASHSPPPSCSALASPSPAAFFSGGAPTSTTQYTNNGHRTTPLPVSPDGTIPACHSNASPSHTLFHASPSARNQPEHSTSESLAHEYARQCWEILFGTHS